MEGAKDNEENECFACNHYFTFEDRLWTGKESASSGNLTSEVSNNATKH